MKISKVIPPLIFVSLFLFSCKPVNDDTPTYTDFSALNNGTPSEKLYELTIELETPQSDLINPDENDYLEMSYTTNMRSVIDYLIENPEINEREETVNYDDTNTGAKYILTSSLTVSDSDPNHFIVENSISIKHLTLTDAYISFYDDSTRILTEGTVSGTSDFSLQYDMEVDYEEDPETEEVTITISNEVVNVSASGNFSVSGFHGISTVFYDYTLTISDNNDDGTDEVTNMAGTYIINGISYEYKDFQDYEN